MADDKERHRELFDINGTRETQKCFKQPQLWTKNGIKGIRIHSIYCFNIIKKNRLVPECLLI